MRDQSAKGAALLLYGHPFLCRKESPFATHYTVVTKQQKEKKTDRLFSTKWRKKQSSKDA